MVRQAHHEEGNALALTVRLAVLDTLTLSLSKGRPGLVREVCNMVAVADEVDLLLRRSKGAAFLLG